MELDKKNYLQHKLVSRPARKKLDEGGVLRVLKRKEKGLEKDETAWSLWAEKVLAIILRKIKIYS